MKARSVMGFVALSLLGLNSYAGNLQVGVTKSPIPLIPAKAVSCYSAKSTPPGQAPAQDIEADYFRIPVLRFVRADGDKQLVISSIRITTHIPSGETSAGQVHKCEISGDELRALNHQWWAHGPEAIVPAGHEIFETDCALVCGGIKTTLTNFTTTGLVEVFGLERDSVTGDEAPVRVSEEITIQSF